MCTARPNSCGDFAAIWYHPGAMCTPEERDLLSDALIAAARGDQRIVSAALTGSGALDPTDRLSDVDLALGIAGAADQGRVVADWTEQMYRANGAVHHLDVVHETILYRVFLFASTLQVDLAFWAAAEFRDTAPIFRLLFGTANERPMRPAPSPTELIGWDWLYALHARSSIARGRAWQAEYMLSGARPGAGAGVSALRDLRGRGPRCRRPAAGGHGSGRRGTRPLPRGC